MQQAKNPPQEPNVASTDDKSDASPSESKEERVARITGKQTIIVTMITVLGALAGAALQHAASRPSAPTREPTPVMQHWFEIEGVELVNMPSAPEPRRIRLVATINNAKYSYPSSVIWEPVQGDMPNEAFPLPVNSAPYALSFIMYLDDPPGEPLTFHSQESIEVTNIPASAEVKLVGFTPGTRLTGPTEMQARVKVSFKTK